MSDKVLIDILSRADVVFRSLDTNQNGFLEPDEIQRHLGESYVTHFMNFCDGKTSARNRDNQIDREEFEEYFQHAYFHKGKKEALGVLEDLESWIEHGKFSKDIESVKNHASLMFDYIDQDQSGEIEKSELNYFFGHKHASHFLEQVDGAVGDGNNAISRDEWETYFSAIASESGKEAAEGELEQVRYFVKQRRMLDNAKTKEDLEVIEYAAKLFHNMDNDDDNELTMEELVAVVGKENADHFVTHMDHWGDGDGSVSISEWTRYFRVICLTQSHSEAMESLKTVQSFQEHKNTLTSVPRGHTASDKELTERADKIFYIINEDKSGFIDVDTAASYFGDSAASFVDHVSFWGANKGICTLDDWRGFFRDVRSTLSHGRAVQLLEFVESTIQTKKQEEIDEKEAKKQRRKTKKEKRRKKSRKRNNGGGGGLGASFVDGGNASVYIPGLDDSDDSDAEPHQRGGGGGGGGGSLLDIMEDEKNKIKDEYEEHKEMWVEQSIKRALEHDELEEEYESTRAELSSKLDEARSEHHDASKNLKETRQLLEKNKMNYEATIEREMKQEQSFSNRRAERLESEMERASERSRYEIRNLKRYEEDARARAERLSELLETNRGVTNRLEEKVSSMETAHSSQMDLISKSSQENYENRMLRLELSLEKQKSLLREQDHATSLIRAELEQSQAEANEAMSKLRSEHNSEISEARSRWKSTLLRLKHDKAKKGQDTELISQLEVTQHQVNTLASLNFEASEKLRRTEAELLEARQHHHVEDENIEMTERSSEEMFRLELKEMKEANNRQRESHEAKLRALLDEAKSTHREELEKLRSEQQQSSSVVVVKEEVSVPSENLINAKQVEVLEERLRKEIMLRASTEAKQQDEVRMLRDAQERKKHQEETEEMLSQVRSELKTSRTEMDQVETKLQNELLEAQREIHETEHRNRNEVLMERKEWIARREAEASDDTKLLQELKLECKTQINTISSELTNAREDLDKEHTQARISIQNMKARTETLRDEFEARMEASLLKANLEHSEEALKLRQSFAKQLEALNSQSSNDEILSVLQHAASMEEQRSEFERKLRDARENNSRIKISNHELKTALQRTESEYESTLESMKHQLGDMSRRRQESSDMVNRVQKLNSIELRRMNETWKRKMETMHIEAERKLDAARDDFERDRIEVMERSRRKVASEKEKCHVALEASEMRMQNKVSNEIRSKEASFQSRMQTLESDHESKLQDAMKEYESRHHAALKMQDQERDNASRRDAEIELRDEIADLNQKMKNMMLVHQRQRQEIEEQRVAADIQKRASKALMQTVKQEKAASAIAMSNLRRTEQDLVATTAEMEEERRKTGQWPLPPMRVREERALRMTRLRERFSSNPMSKSSVVSPRSKLRESRERENALKREIERLKRELSSTKRSKPILLSPLTSTGSVVAGKRSPGRRRPKLLDSEHLGGSLRLPPRPVATFNKETGWNISSLNMSGRTSKSVFLESSGFYGTSSAIERSTRSTGKH